jgi:hypothetical protein
LTAKPLGFGAKGLSLSGYSQAMRLGVENMGRKSSPPPLTPEEFSGMLAAHRRWLRSGGQGGQKDDLPDADLEG